MSLQLQGIARTVGGSTHLHPVDALLEPGLHVLLGPTGAGKTSLMRLMAGLDAPTAGRLLQDGQDVTGVPVRQRSVAFVYQQFINYPSLSVFENIASPLRLKGEERGAIERRVREVASLLHIDHLLDRLNFTRQTEPVVLHLTCSTRRMGLDAKMKAVAAVCATQVVVPEDVGCCGFAGDKGFTTPELNAHALRHLSKDIPAGAKAGYSNSRTCEIGLSDHSGLPYRSIVYLVDACSTPKAPATASTRASEPAF